MTTFDPITTVPDTWINGQTSPDRTDNNYGSADRIQLQTGSTGRRGLLLPELPNILDRTVEDGALTGYAAEALDAQTITVALVTSKWTPGKVTWDDQPTVGSSVPVSVPATPAGGLVTLDGLAPLLQQIADGTKWWGFRLTTNAAGLQKFWASNSGNDSWALTNLTVSDDPEVPTNLRPDGGGGVSWAGSSKILAWDYQDLGGENTEQAESWVQFDTPVSPALPDEVSPDYSSGWQTNVDPQWNINGLHTPVGAGPHYWRVQVRDGDGNPSGWSDWAEFGIGALGSLVLDSPVGAFGDISPTILAHVSTGTIKAWRAIITGSDRSNVRIRSGMRTGAIAWNVPERHPRTKKRVIRESDPGWLYIAAYPTEDRAEAVGEKPVIDGWFALEFDDDLGVTAPTGLEVAQFAPGDPRLIWKWSHNEVPSAFQPTADGVTIARLDPADLTVNAGRYEWLDNGQVSPMRPHTLGVCAVEDGARSAAVTVEEHAHEVRGLWVLPEDAAIEPFAVRGADVDDFARADSVATYRTLSGREVDHVFGQGGRTGTFTGTVDSRDDVWAVLDRVDALYEARDRHAQVVWGSQSIRAWIRSPDATTSGSVPRTHRQHVVRIGFTEVD